MRILECCPKGHVGRGILIDSEYDDAGIEARLKFECELCGERWWEDDMPEDQDTDEDAVDV